MDSRTGEDFQQLYQEVFPVLMRIAYNITGSTDASEELCQEAFIKYLNRGDSLPSPDQAKFWLIRVVKNLCFNFEKRKMRERRAYSKVLNEPARAADTGELEFIKKETNELVRAALAKLPKKFRDPLVLREYGALSYREIGSILHISEGNVKVRVFRARVQLENLLDKEALYVSG
jgi:RNA polymerase sigma-70 factor (ECF subfamily)